MSYGDNCDALAVEVERFASAIDGAERTLRVPSCPGWALDDLIMHLGAVHRWAEELVRTRAHAPVPAPDVAPPAQPAAWVRAGGWQLVTTLREASPDEPMWAWGRDQHARFWARRQLHETLVHRADAELALGQAPAVEPATAADGVDEFLENLAPAARFSPQVANLRGDNERLVFYAEDIGRAWVVILEPAGFRVEQCTTTRDEQAQVTLSGRSSELLLVLYRRRPLAASGVTLTGDPALARFWLENSALG